MYLSPWLSKVSVGDRQQPESLVGKTERKCVGRASLYCAFCHISVGILSVGHNVPGLGTNAAKVLRIGYFNITYR